MSVGNVYFAWVDSGTTWNATTHAVLDEDVVSVEISHEENQFAVASVLVKNPRTGLLALSRKTRAFISAEISGTTRLLFDGSVLGFPRNLNGETIALELVARPSDWLEQQTALLATLKVAPYFEPALVSADALDAPDEVLAARTALLVWSRVGGGVSVSDNVVGEDGTLDLTGLTEYETLTTTLSNPPVGAVRVELETQWTQQAYGEFDVAKRLENAFPEGRFNTLTADDFSKRWPSEGAELAGNTGYRVVKSRLDVDTNPGDEAFFPRKTEDLSVLSSLVPSHDASRDRSERVTVQVGRTWFVPTTAGSSSGLRRSSLVIGASYSQARREVVSFSVSSVLQSLLNGPAEEKMALRTQDVTSDVATSPWKPEQAYSVGSFVLYAGGRYECAIEHTSTGSFFADAGLGNWTAVASLSSPLGSVAAASFFNTARGIQVIENAILRARARLVASARCVEISAKCPVDSAWDLTLRKNAKITDDRIPGGSATGKVKRLVLTIDGATAHAVVTIACSVGTGETFSPGDGESSVGGVVYAPPSYVAFEPINASAMNSTQLVNLVYVKNPVGTQTAAAAAAAAAGASVPEAVANTPTEIVLAMKPLAAYPELAASISINVPNGFSPAKTIDLGAE